MSAAWRNEELRTVLTGGGFFEGPRWHDGTWWVSDFYRHTVSRVTADGEETVLFEVEQQPSGLGWLPDGSLLVVSMKDHRCCAGPTASCPPTPTWASTAAGTSTTWWSTRTGGCSSATSAST